MQLQDTVVPLASAITLLTLGACVRSEGYNSLSVSLSFCLLQQFLLNTQTKYLNIITLREPVILYMYLGICI